MTEGKETLLAWIERDRERLIDFLSRFIQARSPNPPGDTLAAAAHVRAFLEAEQLPYEVVSVQPEMPNIIGAFSGREPGRHLVLNGHMDVFPVNEADGWSQDPWSGAVVDGKIWGRGAVDMKCGTTASLFTYAYLHRLREHLRGRLTLTVVSDEETFGPFGARHLIEHRPDVRGDCCLSGEPSDPSTVRFGERGLLWARFTVRTRGGHGAYPHMSESATKLAAALIADLESLTRMDTPAPGNVGAALHRSTEVIERALGAGAAAIIQTITVNIGVLSGGLKVNMIPSECVVEADIRLPVGVERERIMDALQSILARHPQTTMTEMNFTAPNWCDPEHEMVRLIRANAKALSGEEPQPMIGLGATDMRLWRYRGIPAYVYGPSPRGMGSVDEHVEIAEFLHVVRSHALSAYDYLTCIEEKLS